MTDFAFNIGKGRIMNYAALPAASDRLVALLLRTAGVEADSVLLDKATVSALVSGATDEETSGVLTGYARVALTTVTVTVDNTNDRVAADSDDIAFGNLGGANNDVPVALVICYDASGSDADSVLVPLTKHGITLTPDGSAVTFTVSDFARAS